MFDWLMKMQSEEYSDDEVDRLVYTSRAEYRIEKHEHGCEYIISYTDDPDGDMKDSVVEIRVNSVGLLSIHRKGIPNSEFPIDMNLSMEIGERHFCHYRTPIGEMMIGVSASFLENELGEDGGTLRFRYTVDSQAKVLSDHLIVVELSRFK